MVSLDYYVFVNCFVFVNKFGRFHHYRIIHLINSLALLDAK